MDKENIIEELALFIYSEDINLEYTWIDDDVEVGDNIITVPEVSLLSFPQIFSDEETQGYLEQEVISLIKKEEE